MVLIHILSLEREGEGKVYKADAEAVAELDKCYNVVKDMYRSSDMSYPYKSNDKWTNNYLYSVAMLWE